MFVLDYKEIYSTYKDNLPIAYNLPLFSGHIMWLTMIYEKIETPMKFFLVHVLNNSFDFNVDLIKLNDLT